MPELREGRTFWQEARSVENRAERRSERTGERVGADGSRNMPVLGSHHSNAALPPSFPITQVNEMPSPLSLFHSPGR